MRLEERIQLSTCHQIQDKTNSSCFPVYFWIYNERNFTVIDKILYQIQKKNYSKCQTWYEMFEKWELLRKKSEDSAFMCIIAMKWIHHWKNSLELINGKSERLSSFASWENLFGETKPKRFSPPNLLSICLCAVEINKRIPWLPSWRSHSKLDK